MHTIVLLLTRAYKKWQLDVREPVFLFVVLLVEFTHTNKQTTKFVLLLKARVFTAKRANRLIFISSNSLRNNNFTSNLVSVTSVTSVSDVERQPEVFIEGCGAVSSKK